MIIRFNSSQSMVRHNSSFVAVGRPCSLAVFIIMAIPSRHYEYDIQPTLDRVSQVVMVNIILSIPHHTGHGATIPNVELCKKMRMTETQLNRTIKRLEDAGHIYRIFKSYRHRTILVNAKYLFNLNQRRKGD